MSERHREAFDKFKKLGFEKVDMLYRTEELHVMEMESAARFLEHERFTSNVRATTISQKSLKNSYIAIAVSVLGIAAQFLERLI